MILGGLRAGDLHRYLIPLAILTGMTAPQPGAAMREYRGYRYTIVTIANGAKPAPTAAELWYAALDESGKIGRWYYFRRYASAHPDDAERRVEADFTEWVDERPEAREHGRVSPGIRPKGTGLPLSWSRKITSAK